jgi:hypothetical protein
MDARPLAIRVSPNTISVKGITLFSVPMAKNWSQSRPLEGIRSPLASKNRLRAMAASPTRPRTTVKGGSASTITLKKKNDPPHKTERRTSKAQSFAPISG